MGIQLMQISTNRYAPSGSNAVLLYGTGTSDWLTLGQLVQAVCVRSAAAAEAQSVIKMNLMTSNSQLLDDAAGWLKQVADGTANWSSARTFCVNQLGIPSSSLPGVSEADSTTGRLSSYNKRMQAAAAMQDKMNALAQSQQEDMIDLQTLVNRRDVAFSTASGVVRTMGQSQMQDAANFM